LKALKYPYFPVAFLPYIAFAHHKKPSQNQQGCG